MNISRVWLENAYSRKIGVFGRFDPQNAEQYQSIPPKAHRNTLHDVQIINIRQLVRPVRVNKKQKRQITRTMASWVIAQTTHDVRYSYALQVVVLNFKFNQNRLSGYRDVSGQILGRPICITLANGLCSPVLPYRRDTVPIKLISVHHLFVFYC